MSRTIPARIEPLAKRHDRSGFSCGVEALDAYLNLFARQHADANLGELLLADALQHCLHISESIGMVGLIVDAKDERVRGWYERCEFEHLSDSPLTLWLPTAAIPRA